ncbi:MAG: hypothetical protein WAW54_03175 [Parvibaculum sedimenti]|uniref:hypothetical protein n=1 Tax=Parvibaculum sedimenti TaxID=2608632 RepID=UPI003BB4F44A
MKLFFDVLIFLLLAPVLFIFAYQNGYLDAYVPEDAVPADPFIRAELTQATSGSDLSRRIDKALDAGNFDDATMYADIADYMGATIEPGTAARLAREKTLTSTAMRNTGSFFEGVVTGEGSDTASFMGAITSDLTVVGDVRDIGSEGTKLINGQEYSQFVLGLSVVGLAATTATIATGGGALPAKIGVSLIKISKKAGTLTIRFTRDLTRMLGEAVNFERLGRTLKEVNLTDSAATRHAIADYANGVSMARLTPVFKDVAALEKSVGPAETVRLLKYVENGDDLAHITKMSGKLGTKTRGIIELTGKTSLRAFKTVANLILWAAGWAWALIAAVGAGFVGSLRRRFRRRRAA